MTTVSRVWATVQHSCATGTAVPNAVLAAAPRFSAHLTLQQMDMRDALAYASSSD